MNHEKLWNELKAEMLERANAEYKGETKEYLLYASQILKKMAQAEVEEYNRKETKQKEIDTRMMEAIFPPKFIIKGE